MDEMESLKSSMDARARRDKKKKAKIKAKERQRAAIGLHGQDEEGATQTGEMDLFSLARIKSKAGLDSVSKAEAPGVDAAYDSDDEIEEMAKHDDDFEYDPDLDGDGADNQKRLESELDMLYEEYKTRHKKRGTKFDAEQKKGRADGVGAQRTALGAGELDGSDDSDGDDTDDGNERHLSERAQAVLAEGPVDLSERMRQKAKKGKLRIKQGGHGGNERVVFGDDGEAMAPLEALGVKSKNDGPVPDGGEELAAAAKAHYDKIRAERLRADKHDRLREKERLRDIRNKERMKRRKADGMTNSDSEGDDDDDLE